MKKAATKLTYVCEKGDKYKCPNMEYDPVAGGMESELYECKVCGSRYKLYYEDMA